MTYGVIIYWSRTRVKSIMRRGRIINTLINYPIEPKVSNACVLIHFNAIWCISIDLFVRTANKSFLNIYTFSNETHI